MSQPLTEPVHTYPALGTDVVLEGLVSTAYLHAGERMSVLWTDFWQSMAEYGYVRPVRVDENPDAALYFPTVAQVMALIGEHAVTAPGERILSVTAQGDQIIVRVGTDEPYARDFAVTVPQWEQQATAVQAAEDAQQAAEDARDRAETAANNAQADVDAAALAAAQQVLSDLNQQLADAQQAASDASTDAGRAETAAARAEAAADVTDVQPADENTTGIVRLTGDLGGTATNPTVPRLADKYERPASGIPASDLAQGVQDSLGAADSALQSVASDDITDSSSVGRQVLRAPSASSARNVLDAAPGSLEGTVSSLTADVARRVQQVSGQDAVKVWTGTEAQYNALSSKDPGTLYFRTE